MGKLWIYAKDQNILLNIYSTNCPLERVYSLHHFFFFSTLVQSCPKKNPPEGKHSQNQVMDPVCCHTEMKMSCHTAEKSVPPATKLVTNSAKV